MQKMIQATHGHEIAERAAYRTRATDPIVAEKISMCIAPITESQAYVLEMGTDTSKPRNCSGAHADLYVYARHCQTARFNVRLEGHDLSGTEERGRTKFHGRSVVDVQIYTSLHTFISDAFHTAPYR